jgi:hypothetical protein
LANSASTTGSLTPDSSASMIARPDLPRSVDGTDVNLIRASWISLF